jgi:DNA polymerase III epsilon subunit-like protein
LESAKTIAMLPPKRALVFDLETTGLPVRRSQQLRLQQARARGVDPATVSPYFPYDVLEAYDPARIVSVSWMVVTDAAPSVHAHQYFLVQPGPDVAIPAAATRIHGISQAHAQACGQPFEAVAAAFLRDADACDVLVAHNAAFDLNVMRSELVRAGLAVDAAMLGPPSKRVFCTMEAGMRALGQAKFPSLAALYAHFYPGESAMAQPHDAYYDTLHCWKCFVKLAGVEDVVAEAEVADAAAAGAVLAPAPAEPDASC